VRSSIGGVASGCSDSVLRLQGRHSNFDCILLGSAPIGTGTIALDPTFGSFIFLKPVSLVRVFRL
jgi:hypothetical protein